MSWKDLSIRDKAAIIRQSVSDGIYNLGEIRNRFDKGGNIFSGEDKNQPTQKMQMWGDFVYQQPTTKTNYNIPEFDVTDVDYIPLAAGRITSQSRKEFKVSPDIVSKAYYGKNYNDLTLEQRQKIYKGFESPITGVPEGDWKYYSSLYTDEPDVSDVKTLIADSLIRQFENERKNRIQNKGINNTWSGLTNNNDNQFIVYPKSVDTDESKFMSHVKNYRQVAENAKKYGDMYNVDPYELIAAYNLEGHNPIFGDVVTGYEYYNTHDANDKLLGSKYSYVWDRISDNILKDLGIWNGKNGDYSLPILEDRLNKEVDNLKNKPDLSDKTSAEILAMLVQKGGWNSINPKQKGFTTYRGTIKNDYKTMIESQANKLKEMYPRLFDEDSPYWITEK